MHSLDKYRILFSQSQAKQETLNKFESRQVLQMEIKMQERV